MSRPMTSTEPVEFDKTTTAVLLSRKKPVQLAKPPVPPLCHTAFASGWSPSSKMCHPSPTADADNLSVRFLIQLKFPIRPGKRNLITNFQVMQICRTNPAWNQPYPQLHNVWLV